MDNSTPDSNMQALSTPIAIVIAGALIAVAVYFSSGGGTGAPQPTGTAGTQEPVTVVPVSASDHIQGNPDAQVVVVEYTDLECPFCKRFHDTMKQVLAEYGASGDVAWVIRNFPLEQLHPNAPALAEAAECVASVSGNSAYWAFLDELFRIAPLNTPFPMAQLDATIASVADGAAVKACIAAGTHRAKIQKELSDAVASGGTGTPHNILVKSKDGTTTLIPGAQPFEVVKQAIDAALR